jgi:NAD(P)-dependent dehydrogenase (short-subunit alcohol dehydrogenase family)
LNSTNRVIVITGASAGVGRATAVEFGRYGCAVALLARGRPGLEEACAEVVAAGGRAIAIPTDVSDAAQVERAAEETEAMLGPIDAWVNAAMATVFAPVQELTAAEFHRTTEVTYLGCVYGTLAALKRMGARNRGTIVQVGSALAYRGIPLQAPYCAAKFAIRGFTDSLQSELRHDRSAVRVSMVQLSAFNTPQFDWARNHTGRKAMPVPPVFQPEVAARAIVHAAFHPRRETWVGYPAMRAILGSRLLPGRWIDRYLATRGYTGQLTAEPAPQSEGNLWQPRQAAHGSHGRFDPIARNHSAEAWLSRWRGTASAAAALIAGYAVARRHTLRRRDRPS